MQKLIFYVVIISLFFCGCSKEKIHKLTINFVGDLMSTPLLYSADYSNSLTRLNNMLFPIKKELACTDITVGNLETPISQSFSPGQFPAFNAPVCYLDALTNVGFDILSFANNHSCDQGSIGVTDTVSNLEKYNIKCVGAGLNRKDRILYITNMYKLAFISYTYGLNGRTNGMNFINYTDRCFKYNSVIFSDIKSIPTNHIIILMLHWGQEYSTNYEPWQKELAMEFISNGVDLIIGTHPHVQQPIEILTNNGNVGIVAYSLGNLISTKRKPGAMHGRILRISIIDGQISIEKEIRTYIYIKEVQLLENKLYGIIINSKSNY